MVEISDLNSKGYAMILPFASEFPDTALYYSIKQFNDLGIDNVYPMKQDSGGIFSESEIIKLKNASLIYIPGGDQNRFMNQIRNTRIEETIHEAYRSGALIAGTSAGAAVMSRQMITGNQLKDTVYTNDFPVIQAGNIEIKKGLGLLEDVIIDQHFIKRQRMNRLISVALENPHELCVGIDESTAIYVKDNVAEVYGLNQVITLSHKGTETRIVNGLLGGKGMCLDVYLPGDSFQISTY
jgi:cyanophycinase